MKTYHILNGDCLAESFPANLEGEIIVWRECLISGPVSENQFFENREEFIQQNFGGTSKDYEKKVLNEFDKIKAIPKDSAVYFWFEEDLFCQVNFWFLLSKIQFENQKLLAAFPHLENEENLWKGFSNNNSKDLMKAFQSTKTIKEDDFHLGQKLWNYFSNNQFSELRNLSQKPTEIFRKLPEVVEGNENRFNGILKQQIENLGWSANGISFDFKALFQQFNVQFGFYGFGDLQFQLLLTEFKDG